MQQKSLLPYLIAGCFTLLLTAYVDNIRGPLLPEISKDLAISYGEAGLFFSVGNLAAVLVGLIMIPLLNRFHERQVALGISCLTFFTVIFAQFVRDYPLLLVLGFFTGMIVSSMGMMSNILALKGSSDANRSRNLSLLHFTYGAGSLCAPAVIGYLSQFHINWRLLMSTSIPLIFLQGAYLAFFVPKSDSHSATDRHQSAKLSLWQIYCILLFCIYVSAEVLTTQWLVSYLVEAQSQTIASASPYLMGFFAVMGLSRIACFFFLKPPYEKPVLFASLLIPFLFLILGLNGHWWGFSMAGLVGPFFPVFLGRLSMKFADKWRNFTIWNLAAMHLFLSISNAAVGSITDQLGIALAFILPTILLAIASVMLTLYFRKELHI